MIELIQSRLDTFFDDSTNIKRLGKCLLDDNRIMAEVKLLVEKISGIVLQDYMADNEPLASKMQAVIDEVKQGVEGVSVFEHEAICMMLGSIEKQKELLHGKQ